MDLTGAATSGAPTPVFEPRHAMLDIETLGRKPFCPLLSIGACSFRMTGDVPPTEVDGDANLLTNVIVDVFYQAVTLESCLELGMKPDADTLAWWMGLQESSPSEAARRQLFADPQAVKLPLALDAFTTWLNSRPLQLWGNSARFDLGILEASYNVCGKELPWSFRNERCYRTVKNLPGARDVELVRFGTFHNGLDDAISQALHLRAIDERLQLHL